MEKRSERPSQLITKKFAKELHLNFMRYRARIISKYIQKEDSNAVWFSIEELENYIDYAKAKGERKGYNVNGIRFYFGVYPDEKKYAEKAGLATIFLTATGKKIKTPATNNIQTFALVRETADEEIPGVEPMNYGSIGNPPSLTY
ncbi:hypothetical protein [Flavobacterium ajazii]|uniref:hypothetical protein n=1 Tax=Flavobacterium ajazii TaxID=2692318 RepID=UPI0013CF6656|nr:hypothetical protein [Flavobacterium ajazii]